MTIEVGDAVEIVKSGHSASGGVGVIVGHSAERGLYTVAILLQRYTPMVFKAADIQLTDIEGWPSLEEILSDIENQGCPMPQKLDAESERE